MDETNGSSGACYYGAKRSYGILKFVLIYFHNQNCLDFLEIFYVVHFMVSVDSYDENWRLRTYYFVTDKEFTGHEAKN